MTQSVLTGQLNPMTHAAQLSQRAEGIRQSVNTGIDPENRAPLGQFTTPSETASFMATMFSSRKQKIRLLDPGAGTGALTAAFVAHQLKRKSPPKSISVTAYEIDSYMLEGLYKTFQACEKACKELGVTFAFDLRRANYIRECTEQQSPLWANSNDIYDAVIMNPPYRKINSQSAERHLLRSVGIEVSNLYAAFMLLATRQLAENGEFVSITPRSFCNGPYFKRFRDEFLGKLAIKRIHVFESRKDTFREDDVLQENVIVQGVRQDTQLDEVEISTTSATNTIESRRVSYDQVVRQGDPERVIHIVTEDRGDAVTERMHGFSSSLDDIGFNVSTGRVVDFRAKEHLRENPGKNTAPLIYPSHMKNGTVQWPNLNAKKPNAIVDNDDTASLLIDSGYYVLIKRFSAKEERRRIVASLYDPSEVQADRVGFDNKTNYIHARGCGLSEMEARGLTIFLNSSLVDEYFRLFSGHTQVNAADLKRLPYPTRTQLQKLAQSCKSLADQDEVDRAVDRVL